jgi:hypothetical protein
VAGLPRDQGEFILRRLSQDARNAGVPLAPEKCKANFLVLVSSEPEQLLQDLRRKKPDLFDVQHGLGAWKRFLRTERPVRVWYNWQNLGDDDSFATAAAVSGMNSPSAAGTDWPTARLPNSHLSYSAAKSIDTAVITVDLPRMKGVNLGQLSDYVAMVGLAEINMDREIITAPSVLRLFSDAGNAPADGMSSWDQALLKALYASRATDVMQISAMKTQMVNSIARH